jgi:ubiquinone/menaquinone biosynthesis C-methylase UbiE
LRFLERGARLGRRRPPWFDVVVPLVLLHDVLEPAGVISEIARVLEPGTRASVPV